MHPHKWGPHEVITFATLIAVLSATRSRVQVVSEKDKQKTIWCATSQAAQSIFQVNLGFMLMRVGREELNTG